MVKKYRVKTKKDLHGDSCGFAQIRRFGIWCNLYDGGYVTGRTPAEALRVGLARIEAHKALKHDRDKKVVSYL